MRKEKTGSENEAAAESYYRYLFTAVKRRDWNVMMNREPPEDVDWSALPQDMIDQFENLFAVIGKLYDSEVEKKEV
ncbi:MAG: hypothetical protein WD317_05085 [Balneolaceae bacterium]